MKSDEVYSILVVDDEKVIRDGCNRLLWMEGYRVVTAINGREALDILSNEQIDLILCDLVMPIMGAFELLDEVRTKYPDLPLIVITGHGTIANAVEAMRNGAYDFITKPFRADHLTLIVKRALEKRALERRARELQEEQIRNLYDLAIEKSRIMTIINCMADGVLVTNRELEVVLHNPALMRLFELSTPLAERADLAECFCDESLVQSISELLEGNEENPGPVSRELRKGNKYIHSISASIPGLDGLALGTVTVFQDVTALRELNEMKSSFVQMVSHELRSPLASIRQMMSVLLEGLAGELTEKQRDFVGRSQQKIEDLLSLINEMLDVARIESGQICQSLEPLQLIGMLEDTTALMRPRADERNIILRLDLPRDLPLIQADTRNMEGLFTNLISNAINYSPEGGQIEVSASVQGDYLKVSVSDTGIGIEPEEVSKIFDKFYRVKHPKTRQVRGTGLGLAIVKGIIESHRGYIKVESQPGIGTTFHVLLPIFR